MLAIHELSQRFRNQVKFAESEETVVVCGEHVKSSKSLV